MLITIIILVLSAIFFVNGKIRSDLVALCALVALLIFQILTPDEALSGFSNSVVIMMIGLFVVGGAIFQTGLAKMISSRILKLAGNSEIRLFFLVMLVTSAIGAFVSNTGTVALMLPIVVSLAMSAKMNPSRLLMPLAFASSMGGMMTLIGTPPNLVIQNTLTSAGFEPLSFFTFLPVIYSREVFQPQDMSLGFQHIQNIHFSVTGVISLYNYIILCNGRTIRTIGLDNVPRTDTARHFTA